MSLFRSLACCLLAVLAAGCSAQKTSPPSTPTSQQARRIEVLIRSKFQVDPGVDVKLGPVTKSTLSGYETLPVTFSGAGGSKEVSFLLSNDGKTLARMETFDLTKDPSSISTAGRPVRGPASAKVEIINFDDLECPYCAQLHAQLFPATADHYKGLVKFVYKDYPLVQIHPWAMHAAVDANCLARLNGGAYWNFVDYVHEHADAISSSTHDAKQVFPILDKQALADGQASKVDPVTLAACVEKQDQSPIEMSLQQGTALGVDGTPTLFINGEEITGLTSRATLWKAIDRALKAEGVQPPPEPAQSSEAATKAAGPASPQH